MSKTAHRYLCTVVVWAVMGCLLSMVMRLHPGTLVAQLFFLYNLYTSTTRRHARR